MTWPMQDVGIAGVPPMSPPNPLPEMPKQGEIYHVAGYQAYDDGIWGIFLSEYSSGITFNEEQFDPVELSTKDVADLVGETIAEPIVTP